MLWALGLLKETFKRLCECKLCFQQTPFADTCASRNAVPFAHGAPELRVMGAESGIFRGLSCLPGPPALRPHTTMAQGEEESRARQRSGNEDLGQLQAKYGRSWLATGTWVSPHSGCCPSTVPGQVSVHRCRATSQLPAPRERVEVSYAFPHCPGFPIVILPPG